jgi:hypothetical protein
MLVVRTAAGQARKWFKSAAPAWQPAAVRVTAARELLLALNLQRDGEAAFGQPLLHVPCASLALQMLSAADLEARTGERAPSATCFFGVYLDGAPVRDVLLAHVGGTERAQAFIDGVADAGVAFLGGEEGEEQQQ